MLARLSVAWVVLAASAGTSSCATTSEGDGPDCGEICSLAVLSVVALPCAVAAGVGCIAGGGTRCLEGAPPSEPAPEPASSSSVSAFPALPAKGTAPMEY